MFIDSLILIFSITTATLIWRTLKDDHPAFKRFVRELPIIGESLSCGFCMPMWTTFFVVLIYNPIATWIPAQGSVGGDWWPFWSFIVGWFTVGAGVLLLRNLIIVLMEAGALLKHRHEAGHATQTESSPSGKERQ